MTPLDGHSVAAVIAASGFKARRMAGGEWFADFAGDCERPVPRTLWGRSYEMPSGERSPHVGLDMHVRCRKCRPCLQARRSFWIALALNEIEQAERTWFGTLTIRPDLQFAAEARVRARGLMSDTDEEIFGRVATEQGRLVTDYLKRLRKVVVARGGTLRYLLVTERHASGWPHFHLLVHESVVNTVRKRDLDSAWTAGFTQFRLVKGRSAAFYAAKYIGKDASGRVRGSLAYGRRSRVAWLAERARAARRAKKQPQSNLETLHPQPEEGLSS